MSADWIFDDNLKAFLTVLSWEAKYDADPDEFSIIELGVRETDAEAHRWYSYEFTGRDRIAFSLAVDPGASVVHVRFEAPAIIVPRIEATIAIFAHFIVQKRS